MHHLTGTLIAVQLEQEEVPFLLEEVTQFFTCKIKSIRSFIQIRGRGP